MSNSGDSSPDWLRSYQAPAHNSPVTLSSDDSESLHDSGNFSDEDRIDDEEWSPKSLKISKVEKNKSTAIGGSSAKYSTRKTLKDAPSAFPTPPPNAALNPQAMASLKQAQALAGGPLIQARNFAVMTGVNAGISCVLKRLRGKEDVQSRNYAQFQRVNSVKKCK